MKKRALNKKLQLNRTIMASLNGHDLGKVLGGGTDRTVCATKCASNCCLDTNTPRCQSVYTCDTCEPTQAHAGNTCTVEGGPTCYCPWPI